MKLYVWEGVLTDYTDGLVCVMAESEEQAFDLLKAKDHTAWWVLNGEPEDRNYQGITSEAIRPACYESPTAFVIWGGA